MDFSMQPDPLLSALHLFHHLNGDDHDSTLQSSPTHTYLRERNAMARTSVDVKEFPQSYVFVADMPGLKSADIKVTVENGNVLVLSGERKKEDETDSKVKYLSMERKAVRFMRKFSLPGNADTEHVTAACQDGVLTVTVPKIPPPTPKVINVDIA